MDDLLRELSESTGTLTLRLLAAENDLAAARAWMRDARRSLVWLVEFGAFGGTFAEHLSALAERCPLPEKEHDDEPL